MREKYGGPSMVVCQRQIDYGVWKVEMSVEGRLTEHPGERPCSQTHDEDISNGTEVF